MARRKLYKRNLQRDYVKALKAQQEALETQQAQAKKEGFWGSIGGTVGGLAGQFGTPALLGLLGVATGGLAPGVLLALSAAGAAAGSYLGSKVGEEAAPGELDASQITGGGINLAKGSLKKAKDSVVDMEKQQEDARLKSAIKTGAMVGAQGITMGADKYAEYVKNPIAHYFPGEDAAGMSSSIIEGKDKYSILDIVKKTGTEAATKPGLRDVSAELGTKMGERAIDNALMQDVYQDPNVDYQAIASQNLQSSMQNYEQTKYVPSPVPEDELYTNLLQAIRNPYTRYE